MIDLYLIEKLIKIIKLKYYKFIRKIQQKYIVNIQIIMGSYLNKQKLIISSNHKELTNEKIQILTSKTILNRYQIINLHSDFLVTFSI